MARWRWLTMADPVHGMIQFDRKDPIHRLMLEAVNSKAFQRLRRIRQMGLAEFVFPGAVHSRFNHSLGATYLMSKLVASLRSEKPTRDLLQSTYGDSGISLECLLILGILLHDIGHCPLSHTLEEVMGLEAKGLSHDHHWFYRILSEDPSLQKVWQEFGVTNLPLALKQFVGLTETPKHFLANLVSSQLDMDRLDYLLRDSHFLGVKYGQIESDRIISCIDVGYLASGKPVVTLSEDALPAIEHYLFGRHQAYKMALHSLDKAAEALLNVTLKRFIWVRQQGIATGHAANELFRLHEEGETLSVKDYLRMDDCYLWEAIHCWSLYSEDPLLKQLADRLMQHDLLKFIDLFQFKRPMTPDLLVQVKEELDEYYQSRELDMAFCFDETYVRPKALYLPSTLREPIWIQSRDRGIQEMPEVSSIAQTVEPKKGHKHLLFVWDKEAQQFLRKRLQHYLNE
jgi:uncharacterized protein